jgi:Tol biopolymer transport system component
LWFSSPPGSEPTRYTKPPVGDGKYDDANFQFSPDGSRLLLWLMNDAPSRRGQAAQTGFWTLPMPDGPPQPMLPSLAGSRTPPLFSWFPDNRHIALVRSDGRTPGAHLWLVDTRNDAAEPLTVTNGNEGSPTVAPPDGGTIALTSEATDFDLVTVPVDGSGLKPFLSSTRNEMDPAWSPVRAEYAYVTDRTGTPEIWLRREEGTWAEKALVTDRDFAGSRTIALGALAFSPDGQRLAYQRFSTEGYRIWISPIAGGSPVPLPAEGDEDAPTWSPDGEWIAFIEFAQNALLKVRVGEAASAAVVLKAGTGKLGPDDHARPRWSPKGRLISCQQAEGLVLMSDDGKESRVLSEDDWVAYDWSADGTTIYGLQATEDLHHFMLVSLDVATGKRRVVNANLGPIPQVNEPIRGFSRMRNGAFITSIARGRSDIWLLEGFRPAPSVLNRLWPFSRVSGGSPRH